MPNILRRLRLPVVLAAALLVLVSCTPGSDRRPAVGSRAELGHAGRWLTDRYGRVVNLHGVNFVQKFPPVSPATAGFDADDARFLHDEGFDVVRLGVVFGAVMPQPGVIDQAYVDSIARTVRVLAREDIFTLLDMHQDGFGPLVHGNGFPEWATLTDGRPNPNDPFPTYYVTNPAMQRAFDNFWANAPGPDGVPLQTHYAKAWRAVAAAVEGQDHIAGYDLMNEAWPGSDYNACFTGCPDLETARLEPFAARMTDAIRTVDHDHLVFTEPWVLFNFGRTDTAVHGYSGRQSGLSFHVYAGNPAGDAAAMDHAVTAGNRGDAILATEFGATRDVTTLERLTGGLDSRMIPWIFWDYGTVVPNLHRAPTGANVQTGALSALVRPNPEAVNGTPEESTFDPASRSFDFTYATTRPDGRRADPQYRTSILLPARIYPKGYTVTVDGGRVVTCSNTLAVRNDPRAKSVHVHVTAGGRCARPRVPSGQ